MANQNQGQSQGSGRSGTQNRGFASMSEADQREIARMGGAAVSEDREHMAAIGRRGGEASAEARAALRGASRGETPDKGAPSTTGRSGNPARPRNEDGTFSDADTRSASGRRSEAGSDANRGSTTAPSRNRDGDASRGLDGTSSGRGNQGEG